MKHPSITISGSILAADILNAIEKNDGIPGQKESDFGLSKGDKVKDEIARVYADARFYWQGFKRQMEHLDRKENQLGTSETRKLWMIPLMTMLGYDPAYAKTATKVQDKSYAISHRDEAMDGFPIHIVGYKDSLDKKVLGRLRMSPHAMLQEYLNLTEHLYGIVTNGLRLRLLRDSSRLVKLSYLEFDLERIFEEEHYADFALLYRLLHQSRMPRSQEVVAECLMETYHQQALASGSRIRDGLSKAVETSIKLLGDGFLLHADNEYLRKQVESEQVTAQKYYEWQLRLIYRLLFLMVIEERQLVFDDTAEAKKKRIYFDYYSVQKLRQLSEHRFLADSRFQDYWQSLQHTFRLYESEKYGRPLDVKPLAGELFAYSAIGLLNEASLSNDVLLEVLRRLNMFRHPDTEQIIRVNYGALNVEEFGSVYEGLLEYEPILRKRQGHWQFCFTDGTGRSSSGSHYTPDELVAPLIQHSLDYIIEDKLKTARWTVDTRDEAIRKEAERQLLSITVCDPACGSGHILLNAARRISQRLAEVQTGEEQPSPESLRQAIRQVIQSCIYGVDLNPMAVELCKVALWLEAHNPGEPLNFLDHHIKCGNAIVGAGRVDDLLEGIPDEAFKNLSGSTKEEKQVAAMLRKANKAERKNRIERRQISTAAMTQTKDNVARLVKQRQAWLEMPENNPEEIAAKAKAYKQLMRSGTSWRLRQLADTQAAQFFIPKKQTSDCITDRDFFTLLNRSNTIQDRRVALAEAKAVEKRFFHWFLEFPEVFVQAGFDCILGNPPFLGGQRITGEYGYPFAEYIRHQYAPIGSVDLVTYFFRRAFGVIKESGFQSLISTNTIAQGSAREGGLSVILEQDGVINHAVRSMRWPGDAAVEVALVTVHKGPWPGPFILNTNEVAQITTYLDDQEYLGEPYQLAANQNKSFQGSIVLGKGFVLEPTEAKALIEKDSRNKEVLFPYLNGRDLNNEIDQAPTRWVINFFDWPEEKAKEYPDCYEILEKNVKPERTRWKKDKDGNDIEGTYALRKPLPQKWWIYGEKRPALYRTITPLERVLVVPLVSKYSLFHFSPTNIVFMHKLGVIAFEGEEYFSVLSSTFHHLWAWKNSSTLGAGTLNYSSTDCFENFPFPQQNKEILKENGLKYYNYRKQIMELIQLGLTKTYNQFHSPQLSTAVEDLPSREFKKQYGKETWNLYNHLEKKKEGQISYSEAVPMIEELRRLHKEMDEAVLAAYGWEDIDLQHDFYEVDYLPEKDNIRYTIHPNARKEVLKRLLLLNHERYAEEVKQGLHGEKAKKELRKVTADKSKEQEESGQGRLF